jgi:hypothetical protein
VSVATPPCLPHTRQTAKLVRILKECNDDYQADHNNNVFAAMLAIAALSAPVCAADGDAMAIAKMADKNGMIFKKDFMAIMERKWDEMDKGEKRIFSGNDVLRMYGPPDKGP